jgi:hypothetical protein
MFCTGWSRNHSSVLLVGGHVTAPPCSFGVGHAATRSILLGCGCLATATLLGGGCEPPTLFLFSLSYVAPHHIVDATFVISHLQNGGNLGSTNGLDVHARHL